MKMKVLGIQKNCRFKIDGQEHIGLNLYVGREDDKVEGLATEKQFINVNKGTLYASASVLKPDDQIEVVYNRFGKFESITPIKG